jgi:hemerythrin superfamily protein
MAVAVRNVISKAKTRMSLDVLAMLKMDHREVDALFMAVSKLSERAFEQRRKLAEKICEALQVHSQFEQNVFYPPFRHRAEDHDERETVLEAFEEHAQVDTLVSEIQEMDPRDERYEAKLMVLMDNVKHHVKEEEHEMFPIAKELFEKEELIEMGKRLMDMKRRAGMKCTNETNARKLRDASGRGLFLDAFYDCAEGLHVAQVVGFFSRSL